MNVTTTDMTFRIFKMESEDLIWDSVANCSLAPSADFLTGVKPIAPIPIGLAVQGQTTKILYCTSMGYRSFTRTDGSLHMQPFLIHPSASDIIMSPSSVLSASPDMVTWVQTGHWDNQPGSIVFKNAEGTIILSLDLEKQNGLYYSSSDMFGAPWCCPVGLLPCRDSGV